MSEKIKKFNIGFTQVSNQVLTDKNLSLRAKAIYAYLFSKPDGWVFHVGVMQSEIKESKKMIRSAIRELIAAGYIKRNQINENGRFGGIEYEFIDIHREPKNRTTVKPRTQNCPTNNTDRLNNKNINNTTPYTPLSEEGGGGRIFLISYFNQKQPEEVKKSEVTRLSKWMDENKIDLDFLMEIVLFWIKNKDEYDYAPQVSSLGEMMVKFGGLVRFYENNSENDE